MLKFYQELDKAMPGSCANITKKTQNAAGILLVGYGLYKTVEYLFSDSKSDTSEHSSECKHSKKAFR